MSELRTVLMATLRGLSEKCLKGTSAPTVKWMQEFRLLVEEGRKMEDLGEVEELKVQVEALTKRVMEVETGIALRRTVAAAEAAVRKTPRIMG